MLYCVALKIDHKMQLLRNDVKKKNLNTAINELKEILLDVKNQDIQTYL